jgi:hypothetical protein
MGEVVGMHRETWWAAFWQDWRRLNTYLMIVAIVALSLKLHRVYFDNDPDLWLIRPAHFARWTAPTRPLPPARPMPCIRRPEPPKRYSA